MYHERALTVAIVLLRVLYGLDLFRLLVDVGVNGAAWGFKGDNLSLHACVLLFGGQDDRAGRCVIRVDNGLI